MRNQDILLSLLASIAATGCKQVECGNGTIDRNGICEPSDIATDPAMCGEGTVLVADRCEPLYPPTECDPASTEMVFDEATGVVTCTGIGGAGLACTEPSGPTKQTICGQLYDFETNQKLQAANPTGALCDPQAPTADGPCALTILVYDAVSFANDPTMAEPVSVGSLAINDRGEFRIADIDTNQIAAFVGLGVDDASGDMGPAGYAVTSAIAFSKEPGEATDGVEHWLVRPETAGGWAAAGGPSLTTGIYALVFRAHVEGGADPLANQAGVTVSGPQTPNDFYFEATETTRTTIDTSATATSPNGTALVDNTDLLEDGWTGTGGITDTANCKWDSHIAATLPGIVFIQLVRKVNQFGKTCAE